MNVASEYIKTISGRKVFYKTTVAQRNGIAAHHIYSNGDGMEMHIELPYDRALDMSR